MRQFYFIAIILFTIVPALAQYDSVAMEIRINAIIKKSDLDVFAHLSDSLYSVSKLDQKRYLLRLNTNSVVLRNKLMEGMSLNSLALWYAEINLFSDAYNNYMKALKIFNEIDHHSGKFNVLSNLGALFYYTGEPKKALAYSFKAYEVFKSKLPDRYTKGASICLNIGSMYGELNNISLARAYFNRALEYYKKDPEDSLTKAYIYNNISDTYLAEDDIKSAEKYSMVAFEIKKKYGSRYEKANGYLNLAQLEEKKENYAKSAELFQQGLTFCDVETPDKNLYQIYDGLADIYEMMHDLRNENKFLKLKFRTRKYLDSISRVSEISNNEIKSVYRQQSVNDSIQSVAQLKVRDIKLEQKKRESVYGIIALIAVSILAFLIFNRYRVTQKQKLVIEEQKHLVEDKNKEITDSINYARNLQDALIPNPAELTALFPGAFVIYIPKDIVAGDFYWVYEIRTVSLNVVESSGKNNSKLLVAVADCTGHGVPGALVSVVCINALYRAVNEFNLQEPNEILDKVNVIVNETFSKYSKQVNDGMDISLLMIDYANNEVRWSGANNKLIYFENDTVYGIKPDKQPIGKNENHKPFTLHRMPLVKDSVFYLLTDGYSDQFGGDRNKKMGFAQFKKLMESNYSKPMAEQKINFEKAFLDWKNNGEQTDDVSLIGIKI